MQVSAKISDREMLRRLLLLFVVFCFTSVLAGVSRMWPSAWQLHEIGGSLRYREMFSMFLFAPVICMLFWMICRTVGRGKSSITVDLLMVLAIYCIACGMGIHDPTNRLMSAYSTSTDLSVGVRHALNFLDDSLGHWVFWGGFVLGTWVVGMQQVLNPLDEKMGWPWRIVWGLIALVMGWVMATNLWNEYPSTKADLVIIALAASGVLLFQGVVSRKIELLRQPVLLIMYPAYYGSMIATGVCWCIRWDTL